MLVGLPASGKSTYAKKLSEKENAIILSSDELRKELFCDINNQNYNAEVFRELHKRIKNNLKQHKNVIMDSTNINYKRRKELLNQLKKYGCYKECYYISTSYEKCLKWNKNRDRKVPENVIRKMRRTIFTPQYYEGWDKIYIIKN